MSYRLAVSLALLLLVGVLAARQVLLADAVARSVDRVFARLGAEEISCADAPSAPADGVRCALVEGGYSSRLQVAAVILDTLDQAGGSVSGSLCAGRTCLTTSAEGVLGVHAVVDRSAVFFYIALTAEGGFRIASTVQRLEAGARLPAAAPALKSARLAAL